MLLSIARHEKSSFTKSRIPRHFIILNQNSIWRESFMLSIQVSDTKNFMSHLLSGNTFDHFYFIEASIKMGVSYQIQGRINEGSMIQA